MVNSKAFRRIIDFLSSASPNLSHGALLLLLTLSVFYLQFCALFRAYSCQVHMGVTLLEDTRVILNLSNILSAGNSGNTALSLAILANISRETSFGVHLWNENYLIFSLLHDQKKTREFTSDLFKKVLNLLAQSTSNEVCVNGLKFIWNMTMQNQLLEEFMSLEGYFFAHMDLNSQVTSG